MDARHEDLLKIQEYRVIDMDEALRIVNAKMALLDALIGSAGKKPNYKGTDAQLKQQLEEGWNANLAQLRAEFLVGLKISTVITVFIRHQAAQLIVLDPSLVGELFLACSKLGSRCTEAKAVLDNIDSEKEAAERELKRAEELDRALKEFSGRHGPKGDRESSST